MMPKLENLRDGELGALTTGFSFEWERQAERNDAGDVTDEAALELNLGFQIVARGRHNEDSIRIEAMNALACGPSFHFVDDVQVICRRPSKVALSLSAAAFQDWCYEALALLDAFVVRGLERADRMSDDCDANPIQKGPDSGSGTWGSRARYPAYCKLALVCEEIGAALAPPIFYGFESSVVETTDSEITFENSPSYPMLLEASLDIVELPDREEIGRQDGFDIAALKASHCEIIMEPCSALSPHGYDVDRNAAYQRRDDLAEETGELVAQLETIAREAHYTHQPAYMRKMSQALNLPHPVEVRIVTIEGAPAGDETIN